MYIMYYVHTILQEGATEFPRPGQLLVVSIELLVEVYEPPDPGGNWQAPVDMLDRLPHKTADLGLLRKLRIAGIRDMALLGPPPHHAGIDADNGGHKGAPVADHPDILEVRAEF